MCNTDTEACRYSVVIEACRYYTVSEVCQYILLWSHTIVIEALWYNTVTNAWWINTLTETWWHSTVIFTLMIRPTVTMNTAMGSDLGNRKEIRKCNLNGSFIGLLKSAKHARLPGCKVCVGREIFKFNSSTIK